MTLLVAMGAVLILGLTMQTALTHGTAKLVRAENATWRRALRVVLSINAWGICCLSAAYFASSAAPGAAAITLGVFALLAVGTFFIYGRSYHTSGRQLLGFIALQLVLAGASYPITFLFKQYLGEAYVIPTNAMAPTIQGVHSTSVCPKCGGNVVHTFKDIRNGLEREQRPETDGICASCWEYQVNLAVDPKAVAKPGDRILVDKLADFQRWDIVVFRYPEDPRILYVKRVVGLPSEEFVLLDDGAVSVDGKRIEPPAHLPKLRYSSRPGESNTEFASNFDQEPILGDPRNPMKLGPDEYFMLGDSTHRSLDGRFWGAVKRDAIIAPVALIYWPPSRWRIFE